MNCWIAEISAFHYPYLIYCSEPPLPHQVRLFGSSQVFTVCQHQASEVVERWEKHQK